MSKLTHDLAAAIAYDRYGCSVCKALALMSTEERQSLQEALNHPRLGAKRLSSILKRNGFEVGVPSIHLHRSEEHSP